MGPPLPVISLQYANLDQVCSKMYQRHVWNIPSGHTMVPLPSKTGWSRWCPCQNQVVTLMIGQHAISLCLWLRLVLVYKAGVHLWKVDCQPNGGCCIMSLAACT